MYRPIRHQAMNDRWNEFPPAKSSNLVPLYDGVGEVVALGDDVTRHKIR